LLTKEIEHEPKQTSLGNNRGTTMRTVVAKKTPKTENTTEDQTADAEEVNTDT
jgi:hypothetical protein